MHPFQLPVSLLFCIFFKTFREKPKKGSRVPQDIKIHRNGPQRRQKRSLRINKLNPKAPLRTENMQNSEQRVAKWSRKCYNGVPTPPQMQEKHTKKSKMIIRHENGPQSPENTQEHIYTNSEGNKWRHESANNQTNEQTPTYTLTQTGTLTRPRESSFELQTQTQTPAAGCSPKAT